MSRWLRDLSIAKKLYAIFMLMALLITLEMLTLSYAINTLSAMRVFTAAAGHWNDAQKTSILHLYQYAFTRDPSYYEAFQKNLTIPAGYRKARLGLLACDDIETCEEFSQIEEGFKEGRIPTTDIPNLIRTIRHLRGFPHMSGSVSLWEKGDNLLDQFIKVGDGIHQKISTGGSLKDLAPLLSQLDQLNLEFSEIQQTFSMRMAEGVRFLETALILILVFAMLTVGSIAGFAIFRLVHYFNRSIETVKEIAAQVGAGDFSQRIPVKSKDGLGQMSLKLNQMIEDLEVSIGQKEQAESANKLKSLFVANMSHEVRTPLGVIIGMIEILKDSKVSEQERQKYMEIIDKTGKNLQQIINDILDISKIEAGHLDIHKSKFRISDFIKELDMNLQILAENGKNKLSFRSSGPVPEYILSDRTRLFQILTNLIGNGLKFTHQGDVSVTYRSDGSFIYFHVEDTGIGIPKSLQEKLFQPFSQIDYGPSRKYGGTGLGLVLSKRLAQSLGGEIVLEHSEEGVGSTFTLSLPLPQPAETYKILAAKEPCIPSPEKKHHEVELNGKHILVVEDSMDIQILIQHFLTRKGVMADFANNGQEGVLKATSNAYDLILMDMQMPIVDGYTATEQLRQKGLHIPIIALTAHAMKEDKERCLKVGCNAYLTKPINSAELYTALASHL